MSNSSASVGEQMAIRAVFILVLWAVISGLSYALAWGLEWWLSLLIAAGIVLIGEVIIRTADGGLDFL
jgi:hypothetical protein